MLFRIRTASFLAGFAVAGLSSVVVLTYMCRWLRRRRICHVPTPEGSSEESPDPH